MKKVVFFYAGIGLMMLGIGLSFVDAFSVNAIGNMSFGAGFAIFLKGLFA
jgi:hypothetical protein